MNDYVVSQIRTVVPVAIGMLLTWLAATFGVVIDDATATGLKLAAAGLVVAVYYALVRALETRWPVFGLLLGTRRPPAYVPQHAA